MAKPQQIIIIKRGKGHGGHHGGAWKVAYADFVTAMMALFIVLWLLNTSEHTKKVIAGYFNDPSGKPTDAGTDRAGVAEEMPFDKEKIEKLKEQLQKQIQQSAILKDLSKQVEMTITPEGLRIELLESKDGTFFDSGGTALKADGKVMLNLLADKLSAVPNRVSIEGHTDAEPFADSKTYSNWELSEDRANVARRLMQHPGGLRDNQVSQVRGFASQRLRTPLTPDDPSNRRVSLIVQYLTPDDFPAKPGVKAGADKAAEPPAATLPATAAEKAPATSQAKLTAGH
jgi:chemotaxis protein MotB